MSLAPAERVDCVVVGAGVVGLAVARALALAGREVLILEAQNAIGTQTSARNSEVIHAGMYYPTGSLKAKLCVQGRDLLYAYCEQRGIAHRRCGKLIVATHSDQLPKLEAIAKQGQANGVNDLVWLDVHAAQALEPALRCVAALHSPSTGIVDSHALMLALLGDVEQAGGVLALNSALERAGQAQAAIVCIAIGVGSGWLATILWNRASRALSASLCGQLIVSETLFGLAFAFAVSGQPPAVSQMVASVLFVLGILASIRAHR